MKITILDQENNRVIVGEVPHYLIEAQSAMRDSGASCEDDDVALSIITALGLSLGSCEYMIGDFDIQIDLDTLNGGHGYGHNVVNLEQLTQDFRRDALAALKGSQE